jgi:hypothetical protein
LAANDAVGEDRHVALEGEHRILRRSGVYAINGEARPTLLVEFGLKDANGRAEAAWPDGHDELRPRRVGDDPVRR